MLHLAFLNQNFTLSPILQPFLTNSTTQLNFPESSENHFPMDPARKSEASLPKSEIPVQIQKSRPNSKIPPKFKKSPSKIRTSPSKIRKFRLRFREKMCVKAWPWKRCSMGVGVKYVLLNSGFKCQKNVRGSVSACPTKKRP